MSLTLPEDTDDEHWGELLADRMVQGRLLAQYGDPVAARARADELLARRWDGSRLHRVVVDGVGSGHLWVRRDERVLDVVDLDLDRPALAPELLTALVDLARGEGADEIVLGVVPGSAAQAAVAEAGPSVAMATNLRLDLTGAPVAAPDGLRLDPMTVGEYADFVAVVTADYVRERQESGESPERAARVAAEQLGDLLPDGRQSAHQHFLAARTADGPVGHLWIDTSRPMAFVYDVVVLAELRGRGHGAALMTAGAQWAQQRGAIALGLNVFAQNTVARRLYDRLGYVVTEEHRRLVVADR